MSGSGVARHGTTRVVVATRIFTPDRAAAAFRLQALVEALVDRDAQVQVLTTRSNDGFMMLFDDDDDGKDDDSGVGELSISQWPVLRDASGYVRGYLPYMSFDVPLVLRLLMAQRPDVVVVEPPPTTGVVVRAVTGVRSVISRRRIPYVYYAADVWSDASASTGAPDVVVHLLRAFERWVLAGASDVLAVSDGVADRVRELGARVVHVVPNGIDTDVFCVSDPQPEITLDRAGRDDIPTTPFFLYAGTASEWQGTEVFAEAMRQVVAQAPEARLVFLGQGSSWPALQAIADELPQGAIELRPLVPPDDAARWHRAAVGAVVSVKPGLGYDFAYPTKVLAALACGTPVVYAGPGPAAADLTEHRLGEAVPHDTGAVAGAMLRVLRADSDEEAPQRRARWVLEHRSIAATGATAAEVVLDRTASRADNPGSSPQPRPPIARAAHKGARPDRVGVA